MDAITSAGSVSLHPALAQLSDEDLLTGTRRLVGTSNQLLASLLVHLGEVEARGLHRTRACSSLYTYCIYELRFSEDAAFRRVSAARLVKRFPILFDTVASGELHLTAVLMLGPHLTAENVVDVLARAKHRTKREIAQLVRQLDPLPDIPARIEPLGPTPVHRPVSLRNPSWGAFVRAMNPVRNLNPGERPRDWMDETLATSLNSEPAGEAFALQPAPARSEASEATEGMPESGTMPQRYSIQFTTTSEHVDLVERAKALLSSSHQGASLAEVHLRALRERIEARHRSARHESFSHESMASIAAAAPDRPSG